MHPARTALLMTACLLTACSDPEFLLASADGRIRVLADSHPGQLREALAEHTQTAMIVAFADDVGAITATTGSGDRNPFMLAVGNGVADSVKSPDVLVTPDAGGVMAIALALLIHAGADVPDSRMEVGARVVTPANLAAGGTPIAGAGDAFLALMRMQHARALMPAPASDTIHRVGLVQASPARPWQEWVATSARTEADRFPQLELAPSKAEESPAEAARRLVSSGCRVVLALTSDPATSKAIAAAAREANDKARVIVLDPNLAEGHEVCHVGCPPQVIGRTLTSHISMLLPEGGNLLLCTDDDPMRQNQRSGFITAAKLVDKR